MQTALESKGHDGFNSLILRAVDIGMEKALGPSGAKAMKFYVDPRQLLSNPATFSLQLRKIFSGSDAGAKLLEEKISEALTQLIGDQKKIDISSLKKAGGDLALNEFIEECKKQFLLS